jgi:hypothetical protein
MRDDTQHPLVHHQLRAMVHLVFFRRKQHLEACLLGRLHRRRERNFLLELRFPQPFQKRRELLSAVLESGNDAIACSSEAPRASDAPNIAKSM